ncbi:hypothetical protein DRW03_06295 [Corallococcus sp. H22C18031201]|uniref:hypothetical protein n=1 Tax=Citreicoccus inhibens TaxID=2849499 RepID=UPI000E711210|nr:hypothetical protein [Citreicoccus inhibens]MBU8896216.1 hypothetical protein [Citreicoccus inhibens]RJS26066.1 hypothetical protein DRW03_06295 [Corallococcus sp. H22C18031201]
MKKLGQLLFAMTLGAVVSFGGTQALNRPAEPLSYCEVNCVNQCIEDGFSYGRCDVNVCVCFYSY